MREVNADLVRAARLELGVEQRLRRLGCGHTSLAGRSSAQGDRAIDADPRSPSLVT
jgi:hypothetical protein